MPTVTQSCRAVSRFQKYYHAKTPINHESVSAYARYRGLHRTKVRAWCKGLHAPHVVNSGRIYVCREALDGWVAEHPEAIRQGSGIPRLRVDDVYAGGGTVYALIDPENGKPCYIGVSVSAESRRADHYNELRGNKHANRHLQAVYNARINAGLGELRHCQVETVLFGLGERERHWIAYWRERIGAKLCNATAGGERMEFTEDVKDRIAEISKARWQTPEYKARHREAMDKRWAKKWGVTVEEYRANRSQYVAQDRPNGTPESRERHRLNMASCARRKADHAARVELFKTLTPLTHGEAAYLPLTRGKWAVIDKADWGRVSVHSWHTGWNAGWRARRKVTKATVQPLQRFVLSAPEDMCVSFRNGNQLDCRKENLHTLPKTQGRPRKPKPPLSTAQIKNMRAAIRGMERHGGCGKIIDGMRRRLAES